MLRLLAPLLLSAFAIHAAETVVGGPYVVNVTPRSATVAWVVQTSDVKLGTKPDEWTKTAPVLQVKKISFTGLTAGTTYYYDAMGADEGKGRFKTPPAGAVPFQFVVYGDTRSRHDFHKRVIDAVVKTDPDFVLHTGDLVLDGYDTAQWPIFFSIEKELLRKTAFYPSLGNHERNNRQYYEFFNVSTPYYSFDWGNAHFTVLNSDVGNVAISRESKENFWSEQTRWMEEDLQKAQKADYRFVTFHHPPFTAVLKRQEGKHEVQNLPPLFEKYKVTAVFNGHDHNYQHHVKNGVHYIVTGGGGAPLYPVDGPIAGITRKVESTEHFVQVKVNGKRTVIEAIALDGHVIDTIELSN